MNPPNLVFSFILDVNHPVSAELVNGGVARALHGNQEQERVEEHEEHEEEEEKVVRFHCRPFNKYTASRLLQNNFVTVKKETGKLVFSCLGNYHHTSGTMVQYCKDGAWTGSTPKCTVNPYKDKKYLAPIILLVVCLITIPYLALDFYQRYRLMLDKYEYRNYCKYFSYRNEYPRQPTRSIFALRSAITAITETESDETDSFPDLSDFHETLSEIESTNPFNNLKWLYFKHFARLVPRPRKPSRTQLPKSIFHHKTPPTMTDAEIY